MIKFDVVSGHSLAGVLKYSRSDMGFFFEVSSRSELAARVGDRGRTSLVVDSLQLEVSVETGEVLYVWGYCPETAWSSGSVRPPGSAIGKVVAEVDLPLEEAVSVSISKLPWSITYDRDSGWFRIFCADSQSEEVIEISPGILLGLSEAELSSIWLRPQFCD
ncbi:hypothetical protein JOF56_003958 [Kibdelosporangium banguiense]|uniref:Uncharacterized protein n=1 Tax=Kibdelosporangium banguiense TaxID=1365924 RepID=A0ABS4TI65_9PSEU|nr:hypothetical protein [Kibdelosporangium banguiense]MBP2323573.1 hypothetical protein [Kibdelosporangium banguiense]